MNQELDRMDVVILLEMIMRYYGDAYFMTPEEVMVTFGAKNI